MLSYSSRESSAWWGRGGKWTANFRSYPQMMMRHSSWFTNATRGAICTQRRQRILLTWPDNLFARKEKPFGCFNYKRSGGKKGRGREVEEEERAEGCPETIQSAFFLRISSKIKLGMRCKAKKNCVCLCPTVNVCVCVCYKLRLPETIRPADATRPNAAYDVISKLGSDASFVFFSLLRISFGIRFLASGTSCSQWWYVIKKQFPDQSRCVCVCVCVCSTQFAGKFALRNKSANVSPRSDWEGSPQWAYRFP